MVTGRLRVRRASLRQGDQAWHRFAAHDMATGPWGGRPFNIEWHRVEAAQMPTWAGPLWLRAATTWSAAEPAFVRNQPVTFPRFAGWRLHLRDQSICGRNFGPAEFVQRPLKGESFLGGYSTFSRGNSASISAFNTCVTWNLRAHWLKRFMGKSVVRCSTPGSL
jgi:hypothetical protein